MFTKFNTKLHLHLREVNTGELSPLYLEVPWARIIGINVWKLSRLPNMSQTILRPLQNNRTKWWSDPIYSGNSSLVAPVTFKRLCFKSDNLHSSRLALNSEIHWPLLSHCWDWRRVTLCLNTRRDSSTDDIQSPWLDDISFRCRHCVDSLLISDHSY